MNATEGIRSPYKWHGYWLWPVDGCYDVHAPSAYPDSSEVLAEFLTLAEAREYIRFEIRWGNQ